MLLDAAQQRIHVGLAGAGCEVALPQRHVEGDVLAAEIARDPHAVLLPGAERQQQQWLIFGIVGGDDEGPEAFLFADMGLPGELEIEALIRRR